MRILMFTRHGNLGANSRYRFLQYISLLEKAGHEVDVRSMLDDEYLKIVYLSGRKGSRHTLRGYLRRLGQLRGIRNSDVVLCDQEFLPYFPAAVETLIADRCPRLILDYDDAAYFKYLNSRWFRNRIPVLMAAAESVVAGNRHLAEFARRYSRNVYLVPTVVDTSRYSPKTSYAAPHGIRLTWIGTPQTVRFLKPITHVLRALRERHPSLRLRLIGSGTSVCRALPFAEVVEWSESTETRLLAECDVGLMPLPDNEFTRGKCGLKLIQYMAAGLPVIGSSVGANCDIVSHGHDGYLVSEPQEWFAALERLITGEDLRSEFGRNGVEKVRQSYSLERGFEAWMNVLDSAPRGTSDSVNSTAIALGS